MGAEETKPQTRVLLTGATGRIGRVVLADLLERGYAVRATTSGHPSKLSVTPGVEGRQFNFLDGHDYDGLVAGVDAVIHLAGETVNAERMLAVNQRATEQLATAAASAGISAFCYISSVAVYGSGVQQVMSEEAPVLTHDRDVPSEYWTQDDRRVYGRTKLAGEMALRNAAPSFGCVIMRPTLVVDETHLPAIADRGAIKKALTAHRHAHHVYVGDVSDALIWAMERILAGDVPRGEVETYNLSEDDHPGPRHADFLAKAYQATGDRRFRTIVAPSIFDRLHELQKFRGFPLRNPFWRMRFPNDRLRAAGYRFRFGMQEAERRALASLTSAGS